VCEKGLPRIEGGVDGVFLDLPTPWQVIESANTILRPQGMFMSFSPCIEQVQRTCDALYKYQFQDVKTIECLIREFEPVEDTAPVIPDFGITGETRPAKRQKIEQTSESSLDKSSVQKSAKTILTRVSPKMRGHTGYLTLATRTQ